MKRSFSANIPERETKSLLELLTGEIRYKCGIAKVEKGQEDHRGFKLELVI